MLEKPAQIIKVLKEATQAENDGYHFYKSAAARTRDPKGKAAFRSLAQDELDHASALKGLQHAVRSKNKFKLGRKRQAKRSTHSTKSPFFSAEFKKKLKEHHFELSALRIGQMLERNSLEFYSKHARRSRNPELKALFSYLAEWEKDHLRALVQQERYLKGKL
jgi:rubrerythrin